MIWTHEGSYPEGVSYQQPGVGVAYAGQPPGDPHSFARRLKEDQQQTQQKAVGQTIGQRFSALSTLVQDRFERALRKYKRLDRAFYDRIMAAREVLDRPGTHASPTPPTI